jgi:hypothetical protein
MLVTPPNSPLPSLAGSRSSDVRPATQESARGLAETPLNCDEGAGELVDVCARGGRRPGGNADLRSSVLARASQTASQSVQHPAIIWVHLRTSLAPAGALSGVSEITDTEEVTGSNPVSPTKKALVSGQFATLRARLALGSVDLSAKL